MLAITLVVLVISMGWRFSGYLDQAAEGTLTEDILFLIMAYRLPGFLELILPISFFLSIMLTYGRMHADSEMVVLESTGMSPRRLVMMTMGLAFIVMLLTAMFSLWLKPAGEAEVEMLFADQRNLTEFDMLAPGRFQNLRSGKRVTYAEDIEDQGTMRGVFINETEGSNTRFDVTKSVTVKAQSGETLIDNGGNRFLVLKNGTRVTGRPGKLDFQTIEYEEYGQLIQKEQAEQRRRKRTAISTSTLLDEPTLRNVSEFHWRISIVLAVPLIGLMAIPLSKVNARQGRLSRLVPGMLLCFLYIVGLSAARSALERGQTPESAGLWWVHGISICIVVGLYYLDDLGEWLARLRRSPRS